MPLKFLTFYKGYRIIPSSPSSIRNSTVSPEIRKDNRLYDPPTKSSGSTATTTRGSPSSSTVCLPGTPRHGPLINFDDDYDRETEEETNNVVDEFRGEGTAEEFSKTVEKTYDFGNEDATGWKNVAFDRIAAGRGFRPSSLLDSAHVCNEDKGREDLLKLYGVDEDAIELNGELRVHEQTGDVFETLFDSKSEGGGYESNRSSHYSDNSWCTTYEMAASPTENTSISENDGDAAVKTKFVSKWLGLRKKTRPTEGDRKAALPRAFSTELLRLVNAEVAEWAKVNKEVSETSSDAVSNDAEPSFQQLSSKVSGNVGVMELDSLLAQMQTAEEGQSTKIGTLQTMRHYGDDTSDSVEYVVVDRPSLDFLDRLGALEGANLRNGSE